MLVRALEDAVPQLPDTQRKGKTRGRQVQSGHIADLSASLASIVARSKDIELRSHALDLFGSTNIGELKNAIEAKLLSTLFVPEE